MNTTNMTAADLFSAMSESALGKWNYNEHNADAARTTRAARLWGWLGCAMRSGSPRPDGSTSITFWSGPPDPPPLQPPNWSRE
jgi:hypothetical protein